MVVAKLTLDGRTAAIEAGFIHRATFHLYLRAFAPEFANLGPGNILTERMLEWCADNAIERYDMLAPRSRNKAEWQSGEVAVADFALPMTWLEDSTQQRCRRCSRQRFARRFTLFPQRCVQRSPE